MKSDSFTITLIFIIMVVIVLGGFWFVSQGQFSLSQSSLMKNDAFSFEFPTVEPSLQPEDLFLEELNGYTGMVFSYVPELELKSFYNSLGVENNNEEFSLDSELILGGTHNFMVAVDFQPTQQIESLPAEVRYLDPNLVIWQQQGLNISNELIEYLRDKLENEAYSLLVDLYGTGLTDEKLHLVFVNFKSDMVVGYFDVAATYGINSSHTPNTIFLNAKLIEKDASVIYSVVSHELTHLLASKFDGNEDEWITEGIAEYTPFSLGLQNSSMINTYLEDTTQQLNQVQNLTEDQFSSSYGGGALYLQTLANRCGDKFIGQLMFDASNGTENINSLVGEDCGIAAPVDSNDPLYYTNQSFIDFAVSLYTNRDAKSNEKLQCKSNIDQTFESNQYGISYFDVPCRGTYTIDFQGETSVVAFPEAIGHGQFVAMKNAVTGRTQMIRGFDLSEVGNATLNFEIFHSIGSNLDSIYVEVSNDGENWTIISYPEGAVRLSNNNLKAKYDGNSNGWVSKSIDISDFAGEFIFIKFEVLNFGEIINPEVLIDSISIPEIEYIETFDSNIDESWFFSGFVQTTAIYPQYYQLAWIPDNLKSSAMQLIEVDPWKNGHISTMVSGKGTFIVIPTTSQTTETTNYTFTIGE